MPPISQSGELPRPRHATSRSSWTATAAGPTRTTSRGTPGTRRASGQPAPWSKACVEAEVQVLTLFAFSSENWQRPAERGERPHAAYLSRCCSGKWMTLHENGIQLKFIGDRETCRRFLRKRIAAAEAKTTNNTRMTLVLAVAYGGRWDIVQASRRLAAKVRAGDINAEDIDEAVLGRHIGAGRAAGTGSADSHRGRAARQQFPALGPRLHGDFLYRLAVARFRRGRFRSRHVLLS